MVDAVGLRAAVLLVLALLATGCSVAVSDVTTSLQSSASSAQSSASSARVPVGADADALEAQQIAPSGLPAIGPVPDSSHWHAAYLVRICDEVLAPFEDRNESLGIHTHGDGLIHIHPFVAEVGFEEATLERFGEVVGLELRRGELVLPGGGTWRNGDECNGVEGRVYVDRWAGPSPDSEMLRHFGGFDDLAFVGDGEMYSISFAPVDAPPVIPPSVELLPEVSNLVSEVPEPWVRVDARPGAEVVISTVVDVGAEPCTPGSLPDAVLSGSIACYQLGDQSFEGSDVITSARAVDFNRQPAVELRITPTLRRFIIDQFVNGTAAEGGLVLALVADGEVLTAPLLARPSASEDRLVISGGLSVESAEALAALLQP